MMEMATAKISIAIGRDELRLARRQAAREGMSLSAFISRAVHAHLEECDRQAAAKQYLASYAPHELPTKARQKRLLALWSGKRKPTRRELYGR